MGNVMDVNFSQKDSGFSVSFRGKEYNVDFPNGIWKNIPEKFREFFIDNYAMLKTSHLPLMFGRQDIKLNTSRPLFKEQFIDMQMKDIPSLCYSEQASPDNLKDNLRNSAFTFDGDKIKKIRLENFNENSCVISLSFGKDSLLSLGLAREIGLKPYLFMSEEKGAPIEFGYKEKLSKRFSDEFGFKVNKAVNETMLMHSFSHFKIESKNQYLVGHLMAEYVFLMLPFAYNHGSKYLFLSNERSCNDYAVDKFGNKCYAVFDQSSEWTAEMNKMLSSIGSVKVSSLIEPIGDLAALKILHNRYPELAKYQYSCFPDESRHAENERWCCNCSKCARIYVMLTAIGINPKDVGFTKDMLGADSKHLYPIFGKKGKKTLYDELGTGKNEQIYAFYLAYKNGVKGKLIDEFRKMHLELAKEKEEEWRKEFFSAHDASSIPQELKRNIYSIYKEELDGMQ